VPLKDSASFVQATGVVIDETNKLKSHNSCTICGRDLTITLDRLEQIFPENENLTQIHANYFTKALMEGKFNTCKMHAHFFSQVYVESGGMKDVIEKGGYSFDGVLALHKNKSDVQNVFINQSFFDDNKHVDYFYIRTLKNDKKGDRVGLNLKTYKSGGKSIKIPSGNPNSRKAKKKEKGVYSKVTTPENKQETKRKKLFNVIYSQTNGNTGISSGDGYNYRGRGVIQLTGRENYRESSKKANLIFKGEQFNWEVNFEDVSSKLKDQIYSAVAYFHDRYIRIRKRKNGVHYMNKQSSRQVSYDVNGGYNDVDERESQYIRISNNVYQITKCKKK
jgi:predicted chitinase